MPSLRDIRGKIKSVKSTEQITRAMKMVAAARLKRAQTLITEARPFAAKMEAMVRGLAPGAGEAVHELLRPRPEIGAEGLLLVAGDKGLCGAFNANVLRAASRWLAERQGRRVHVAVAGRKARAFLHRARSLDFDVMAELVSIFPRAEFSHAEILGRALVDGFLSKGLFAVTAIYNEFKSVSRQAVAVEKILPVEPGPRANGARAALSGFEFEPRRQEVLSALLPRYLKAKVFRILLESQAAELAARTSAMDAAAKNAGELRASLNLALNRRRQAIITNEIAELVGGAEALANA